MRVSFVDEFRARGYIADDGPVSAINRPIDFTRRDLRAWLQSDRGENR